MLHKNRVYTIFSTCLKLYLFIYRSSYLGLWLSLTAPTTRLGPRKLVRPSL
jgi:hypothetical protein